MKTYTLKNIIIFLKRQQVVRWFAIEEICDAMDDDSMSDHNKKTIILFTLEQHGLCDGKALPCEKQYPLNSLICFFKAQQLTGYTSIIYILDTLKNRSLTEREKQKIVVEELKTWDLYAIGETEENRDRLIFPQEPITFKLMNCSITIGFPLN